jgi:uncharacterized protein YjbI with pentapeptide repeats
MVNAASDDRDPTAEAEESTEISFHNRNLRGYDLSNKSLQNIDFSEADLRGCKLTNADLSGANFQGALLGIDDAQVFELLIQGFLTAIVVLLYLILWLSNGGRLFASSDDPAEIDNPKTDSTTSADVSLIGLILWIAFVGIGLGIYILLAKYPTPQLTSYVYDWIGFWTVVWAISLIAMTVAAMGQAKTDFGKAILDGARIDRTTFQKAKTDGAKIDHITWL